MNTILIFSYIFTAICWGLFCLKMDKILLYDKYELKWGRIKNTLRHYVICGIGNSLFAPISIAIALKTFYSTIRAIKKV